MVLIITYNKVNNIGDLERILQGGRVLQNTSVGDRIVPLQRNCSQEVDGAKYGNLRSDL